MPELYDYQLEAIKNMHNGCILCGGVGSGKSRTAIGYYYLQNGGIFNTKKYVKMKNPQPLYIITTAQKRDKREWESDLIPFFLSYLSPELSYYPNLKIIVDSWNNISKYIKVSKSFFIFDEQRLVGNGAWVHSFYKIAKQNNWILLSATPGDKWEDYIPVFIANGFYKNRTEFVREHLIYSPHSKFPKVERYINTGRLIRLRRKLLVDMEFNRCTIPHHEDVYCSYDVHKYKQTGKNRWDPFKDEPIQNIAGLCYIWRKIVNSDDSRQIALLEILEDHPKAVIFYNFDYELEILKTISKASGYDIAEWNGHAHQPIPTSSKWVYLVQYTAGCEGWNCITTDTVIFYSQNYSYKVLAQACGRIDRLNTPFKDLYYFHIKSRSGIDLAISRALKQKKKFNEGAFVKW